MRAIAARPRPELIGAAAEHKTRPKGSFWELICSGPYRRPGGRTAARRRPAKKTRGRQRPCTCRRAGSVSIFDKSKSHYHTRTCAERVHVYYRNIYTGHACRCTRGCVCVCRGTYLHAVKPEGRRFSAAHNPSASRIVRIIIITIIII